jgi:hypothetical protein
VWSKLFRKYLDNFLVKFSMFKSLGLIPVMLATQEAEIGRIEV